MKTTTKPIILSLPQDSLRGRSDSTPNELDGDEQGESSGCKKNYKAARIWWSVRRERYWSRQTECTNEWRNIGSQPSSDGSRYGSTHSGLHRTTHGEEEVTTWTGGWWWVAVVCEDMTTTGTGLGRKRLDEEPDGDVASWMEYRCGGGAWWREES